MIVSLLKRMRPLQLFRLAGMFLWYPLYAFPTVKATMRCMKISDKRYGASHHGDNKPNAFRHALWNVLIVRHCLSWRKGIVKALNWTEKITTWHESFSKNDALSTAMDLHNNRIGRAFVSPTQDFSERALIDWLAERSEEAKIVTSPSEIDKYPNELVYISEVC